MAVPHWLDVNPTTVPSCKRKKKMEFRRCEEFSVLGSLFLPFHITPPRTQFGSRLWAFGHSQPLKGSRPGLGHPGPVTSEVLYGWLMWSRASDGWVCEQSFPLGLAHGTSVTICILSTNLY